MRLAGGQDSAAMNLGKVQATGMQVQKAEAETWQGELSHIQAFSGFIRESIRESIRQYQSSPRSCVFAHLPVPGACMGFVPTMQVML